MRCFSGFFSEVLLRSADFENAIAAILRQYPAEVYLAAVSGGADSTAMLAALAAIRDRAVRGTAVTFQLHCIHVEHGIRPPAESQGDAAFVRSLCEKLKVPCRIVPIPPGRIAAAAKDRGMGIEAAARHYRRRAWFRAARLLEAQRLEDARPEAAGGEPAGAGVRVLTASAANGGPARAALPVRILTAHTADDALETALMRILRGAGPSGLAAMPVSRGRVLRPLLALSRSDVLGYLSEKNISWREDSTNADTQFLRNRIRHRLIPLLDEAFPQWQTGITALAQTQSLAANFIRREAAARVQWQPAPCALCADTETFFAQPPIICEEALFQAIDRLLPSAASRTIKRKNIRRFCKGGVTAINLGPLRLAKNAHQITLSLFTDPRAIIAPAGC